MNFTIDQTVLDEVLKTVQFALLTRPSMPVLNNVLIKAENNEITFFLTDLEIAISCSLETDVVTPGETTLPMRTLTSIVRRLPNQPVTFDTDGEFTVITCNEIKFKILGISTTEFPSPFNSPTDNSFDVPKNFVRRMVICTSIATGNDPVRPIISGPLLKIQPDQLTCVATDGRRLALISEDCDCQCEGACVIPPKTASALMKLMAGKGDVTISFDDKAVQFDFTNEYGQKTVISSKLIEGRYPKYEAIIPKDYENEITLPREELYTALKRISLILNDTEHGVKLKLEDNLLTLHATTEDDESKEEIQTSFTGGSHTIAFNPFYLMDPLKRLEDSNIELKFSDSRTAASLQGDHNFLYVLMPMRM